MNICNTACSDIACLEHLMVEVQQGQLDLSLPPNLPILKPSWRNIRPMRSCYIYPSNASGQGDMSSEGSDIAVSPTDIITGSDLPPVVIVTESMSPIPILTNSSVPAAQPSDMSPSDNAKDEYYPSPISSTGLKWEFSQDGSDHESSIDFAMSEDCKDATLPNSGSE